MRERTRPDGIITWQVLGCLRYALLALKSQLLLVEDVASVLLLLLLSGGRAGRFGKAILAVEAVLS